MYGVISSGTVLHVEATPHPGAVGMRQPSGRRRRRAGLEHPAIM